MNRKISFVLVWLLFSFSSFDAFGASAFSMYGGKTIGGGRDAIAVGLGYPGLFFEYGHGLTSQFDIGFRFEFDYGFPPGDLFTSIGLVLGVPMRWNLLSKGIVDLAIRFQPSLFMGYTPDHHWHHHYWWHGHFYYIGLGLDLGVPIGIKVHPRVTILTGMSIPASIFFISDPESANGAIPVAIHIGTEVHITNNLNFLFLIRVGPAIFFGEHTDVDAYLNVYAGIEFLF
jgi:hypothetical protein